MKHEKQILTDFNEMRWSDINIESVRNSVSKLSGKTLIGHDGHCNKTVETHKITNVTIEDRIVYGDVEFMDSEIAKEKEKQYADGKCRFSVEGSGKSNQHTKMVESLTEIETWDLVTPSFKF